MYSLFLLQDCNSPGNDQTDYSNIVQMRQETSTEIQNSVSRSHEGLDLGLSISKKIVENMGGTIRVESEPGRGSIFYFSLLLEENKP